MQHVRNLHSYNQLEAKLVLLVQTFVVWYDCATARGGVETAGGCSGIFSGVR